MPDEVPVLVTELKIETQTASWRSDSARAKPTNAPVKLVFLHRRVGTAWDRRSSIEINGPTMRTISARAAGWFRFSHRPSAGEP